jgi:hypothetical protein
MPYSQVNALDYADIKTALREYLRQTTEFTDYDFEASSLSAILDLLSYNTYYNAFNINMAVNEAFLDSASLRDNVVRIAKQLGYIPKSRASSKAIVKLVLDVSGASPTPKFITLKKGNVFTASDVNNSAETYQFSILNDITAPVTNSKATISNLDDGTLEITQGIYVNYKFTVDTTIPNQRFIIPTENLDTRTVNVYVRDNINSTKIQKYIQVDNFLTTSSDEFVFFIRETNDTRYELLFGDGVVGRKLQNGEIIEVSYLVSAGKDANDIRIFSFCGEFFDEYGTRMQNKLTLTLVSSSTGGDDKESVESIKSNAPSFYASQNRAVTEDDFKAVIQKIYPSIADIIVYGGENESPPEYGRVKIAIKPKFADKLSNSTKNYIRAELKKYTVASVTPVLMDPSIIDIILESKIFYNPLETSLTAEQLKQLVIDNLTAYKENSGVSKFNGTLRQSKVSSAIDASDDSIISNQTKIHLRKTLLPAFNTTAEYIICFNNPLNSGCGESPITSSSFIIAEYPDDTAFFEASSDGIIQIYTINSITSEKKILKRDAGTINFATGEIKLTGITFLSGSATEGNEIYITLVPLYPDIEAVRETYLNLSIEKSKIQLVAES